MCQYAGLLSHANDNLSPTILCWLKHSSSSSHIKRLQFIPIRNYKLVYAHSICAATRAHLNAISRRAAMLLILAYMHRYRA